MPMFRNGQHIEIVVNFTEEGERLEGTFLGMTAVGLWVREENCGRCFVPWSNIAWVEGDEGAD